MSFQARAATSARMRESRVLVIDIERLPGLAYAWEPKTRYIPAHQWVRWPSLLCFAAKWVGERQIEFHATWDDHEAMVKRSWELFDEADAVVTFNGVRFDVKHLKSEWLTAGLPLPSPHKDVDLFAEVRRSLGFESKSLDQVCKRLGIPGKSGHYDTRQAEAAASGDEKAQRAMRRYNESDVRITTAAYQRLLGWLPGHPVLGRGDDLACNQCGSTDLERNGWYRAVTQEFALYRCRKCSGQVRSNLVKRVSNTRGVR